jgi:NTE family protein
MHEPGGTPGACGPQHRLAGLVAPLTARASATRPPHPVPVGGRAPASRVTVAAPARRVASLRPAGAPRTAFVLAGGAALGAMQAGMLHALYERGVVPDLLVGTSAGALNAAYVASRPQTVATARGLAAVWCGLRRKDVFPLRPATLLPGLTGRSDHLATDRGLRRLAARHLQITRLEDASIPLHLIAWDLLSGQEARLSEGPTIEAVLAAAAIPGLLPPVRLDGRLLTDGGVANNTPISHAIALGAERIYVLPTSDPAAPTAPRPPRSVPAAAASALTHLLSARLQADLARYATTAEIITLPATNPQRISLTSFSHAPQLIAQALTAARTVLAAHDAHPARARAS